jgi:hypothetical protein
LKLETLNLKLRRQKEMRPDNSCELAGRRLSGQVRVIQGWQIIRLENRHLWPIPYFMVVLLLTGEIKSCGLKIKKLAAAAFENCTASKFLPRNPNFKHLKAW